MQPRVRVRVRAVASAHTLLCMAVVLNFFFTCKKAYLSLVVAKSSAVWERNDGV